MSSPFVSPSHLRSQLVQQILNRFEASMPIYKQMMAVAKDINDRAGEDEALRLGRIMHAAIRCASDAELRSICDLFALLDCHPVNYYDLRERVSVESTAFRPTTPEEIEQNGFRVFCSKLAMDCIPTEHQGFVREIIDRRCIFSAELLSLMETGRAQGGFDENQAERFIEECVRVFSRPETALISIAEYEQLREINKVAAQVLVCNALAFNHLTPSVASVPDAHAELTLRGIKTIPVWQGPVGRDVILRQTSCLAPAVRLKFPVGDGSFVEADYQETFVEFEERLQALTPRGRELFESLFDRGKKSLQLAESDPNYADHYYEVMRETLAEFPTDSLELWQGKLAYFRFSASAPTGDLPTADVDDAEFDALVASGTIRLLPQQYEDFFGPAATNIFNSNIGLDGVSNVGVADRESQSAYEQALGRNVVNMYDYYDHIQEASRQAVCHSLASATAS
ncbi:MAG: DUF1338 family protein [Planctomycetota bacterium]